MFLAHLPFNSYGCSHGYVSFRFYLYLNALLFLNVAYK